MKETYGVLYPTYGIRVKKILNNSMKRNKIRLACLSTTDFLNMLKLLNINDKNRWVGFCVKPYRCIVIDAEYHKHNFVQADVDHTIIHEILHILHPYDGEEDIEGRVKQWAKRLGIRSEGVMKVHI